MGAMQLAFRRPHGNHHRPQLRRDRMIHRFERMQRDQPSLRSLRAARRQHGRAVITQAPRHNR